MKKLASLICTIAILSSFAPANEMFMGKIIYKNSATDMAGNDITAAVAPYVGFEQHYYIDGKNYKSTDEKGNLRELFHSSDNIYYSIGPDNMAEKIDASTNGATSIKVNKLDKKEKIAGYDCVSIQIVTEKSDITFFYSPLLKTDAKAFSKHAYGEWDKYMEASGGALPLKFIYSDAKSGFILTSTATSVTKMTLLAKDFELPEGVKAK